MIGLIQVGIAAIIEVVNILVIIQSKEILDVVGDFMALSIIGEFDNYFFVGQAKNIINTIMSDGDTYAALYTTTRTSSAWAQLEPIELEY